MYPLTDLDMMTSNDVSWNAVKGLLRKNCDDFPYSKIVKLKLFFTDINLGGILEKNLLRSTRLMNSIGKQFSLDMDKTDVERLVNETGNFEVRFRISGNLNKAELVVGVTRNETSEKWIAQNSSIKVLWKT